MVIGPLNAIPQRTRRVSNHPCNLRLRCGRQPEQRPLDCALSDVVPLGDNLSYGPLGPVRDLESWRTMRLAFWEHISREPASPGKRKRRGKRAAWPDLVDGPDRLAGADDVVTWLGTGLADQLTLAWMPQMLRTVGGRPEALRVVQFQRTASGAVSPTVAILNRDEIRYHPAPLGVGSASLAYLDDVWSALISSRPDALIHFLDAIPRPLPLLGPALGKMLFGYPDLRSGVNRYDTQLLVSTKTDGPTVARVIASAMKAFFFEQDECVGDNWLFWRLRRLADPKLPHPAVTLTGQRTTMRGTEASLTAEGERVLNGELNFVKLNGIDDWVGGVHLDSRAGDVWFNNDQMIVRG